VIIGEKISAGKYLFSDLYPADYKLKIRYGSVIVDEPIMVPHNNNGSLAVVFPVLFNVTTTVFDARGNPLKNVKVLMIREDQEIQRVTDKNGNATFSLPPGVYVKEIYSEDKLIAKQKINILHEKTCKIVTTKEPLIPQITICLAVIIIALSAILTYRKKNMMSFLKILAVSLAIMAIVSPWWATYGSSSNPQHIETSTKMFLIPDELVTITSSSDVVAGEMSLTASSDEDFVFAMEISRLLLVVGCIFIISSILLKKLVKKRYSVLSLLFGALSLIGVVLVFSYAMTILTNIGPGSLFGNGNLDIAIPGEGIYETVACSWGHDIGFYLCLTSIIIILSILVFTIKKLFDEIDRSKKIKTKFGKKNLIKYFKKLMPLIGIFIFIYLIYDIGTGEIISTFLKLSPLYVAISLLFLIPRLLIRNFQWQIILKKQKIDIKFIKSLKIMLIGFFYGCITPGYLGGAMTLPYMKEETKQPIGKLFVNRSILTITSQMSLYCMMILGTFLLIEQIPRAFSIACIFFLINAAMALFFIKKTRGEKTFYFLINTFIPKKARPILIRFVDTFYRDFPSFKDFLLPFLIGFIPWILIYSQIYVVALSLDIQIPYFTFLMIYPIANVIAFIPISTGGLGTREATLIFLFSFFGVSSAEAVVISLSGHLLTDMLPGFGGFILSTIEARNNKKSLSEAK